MYRRDRQSFLHSAGQFTGAMLGFYFLFGIAKFLVVLFLLSLVCRGQG